MACYHLLQSGHSATNLLKYHKNIPYPRTCGATFCNDRLITFQRPVHPAVQSTPRALNDVSRPLLSHVCAWLCWFVAVLKVWFLNYTTFCSEVSALPRKIRMLRIGRCLTRCVDSSMDLRKPQAAKRRLTMLSSCNCQRGWQ